MNYEKGNGGAIDAPDSRDFMAELKDCPGYGVDRDGGVWSRRAIGGRRLGIKLNNKWRRIKAFKNTYGYLVFGIRLNGRQSQKFVHRAVLESFVGPQPSNMQACHNNGKCDDNRLENLRWDALSSNQADRVRHDTHCRGERNPTAKLTSFQVQRIRLMKEVTPELSNRKIGKMFKMEKSTIAKILNYKLWAHIF